MKNRYISVGLIALALFSFHNIAGQTMIPKKCYMHLTGQAGREYEITLELVKINDSIYADYNLRGLTHDAKSESLLSANDGDTHVICGKMKADGSCSLGSFYSKVGPFFTGQFTKDQKLAGTWEYGNRKFPLELREKYADGSLQFNVSYLKGAVPLVKKPGSPKGSIAMALLTPVESTNPVLSDSLKKIILGKFIKRPVSSDNPDINLNSLKENYTEKYIASNEALYDNKSGGPNLNWESLEFMHILYNDKHFLSFYIISYAFTGGAHGLETYEFYVIDLKSGKIVTAGDLFTAGFEKDLSATITRKFRDDHSLKPGQQLTEAGFFTDEIKPTDNLFLTGDGIGFFYNHYEIAPYASSPNSCFLPFSELKAVIDREGVLRNIIQ